MRWTGKQITSAGQCQGRRQRREDQLEECETAYVTRAKWRERYERPQARTAARLALDTQSTGHHFAVTDKAVGASGRPRLWSVPVRRRQGLRDGTSRCWQLLDSRRPSSSDIPEAGKATQGQEDRSGLSRLAFGGKEPIPLLETRRQAMALSSTAVARDCPA